MLLNPEKLLVEPSNTWLNERQVSRFLKSVIELKTKQKKTCSLNCSVINPLSHFGESQVLHKDKTRQQICYTPQLLLRCCLFFQIFFLQLFREKARCFCSLS